jgi:hypothetical protein
MEILRFEEAGSPTPRRKKSSRGMIIAGLIATLFGVGSAFASTTISINTDVPVSIGQGVIAATACDSAITTKATMGETSTVSAPKPSFYLETMTVTDVDTGTASSASGGVGCTGKYLNLQIFHTDTATATNLIYSCSALGLSTNSAADFVTVTSPLLTGSTCVSATGTIKFLIPSNGSVPNPVYTIPFPSTAPGDISYFTLVSSDS